MELSEQLSDDENDLKIVKLTSRSELVLSITNVNIIMKSLIDHFMGYLESYDATIIKEIIKLDVYVAKVKSLNGKSYKELPDFIKNKNSIINIKNDDNLCFLYSVLCGLKTPEYHPERVSHYYGRLNELIYNKDDFEDGMSIHKIRFFEKRNNIKINVYSLENKQSIIPVYISSNDNKDDKLIHLFLNDQHYSYINNFNRLVGEIGKDKLVCPYCCQFRSSGGDSKDALEKH
jgi:hypothetical protein